MLYTPNYNFAHVVAKFAGIDVKTTILKTNEEVKELIQSEGSVPVFKDEHGTITGSIAIARYFARQAPDRKLLGSDEYEEALVDEYMNICDIEIQSYWNSIMYLITGRIPCENQHKLNHIVGELKKRLEDYNRILEGKNYLVGNSITLADIQLASCIAYPLSLAINSQSRNKILHLLKWYHKVTSEEGHFESVFGRIKFCSKVLVAPKPIEKKEEPKKKKEEPKKEEKKPKEEVKEELPPTNIIIDDFKRFILNSKNKEEDLKEFIKDKFERSNWSIWHLKYQIYKDEGALVHKASNLCSGFLDRAEECRKLAFGIHCVLGEEPNLEIEGVWMWRGMTIPKELQGHPTIEYYDLRKLDVDNENDAKLIQDFWCRQAEEQMNGKKCQRKFHI